MRKELANVLADGSRLFRYNPLVGIAMLPPFCFSSIGRNYVRRVMAEEQNELRLRAVAGDRFEEYLGVARTLQTWTEQRGIYNGTRSLQYHEAVDVVVQLVMLGVEPSRADIHEHYQLMEWGMQ